MNESIKKEKKLFNEYLFSLIEYELNYHEIQKTSANLNRKYGLTPIFRALKSALMLETFDKKYIWAFIISHALLIYTFSATGMLTLMYALFAIIYLVLKRRDKLLEMAKYFSILLIVSIPVIAIMIYNKLVFNSEI